MKNLLKTIKVLLGNEHGFLPLLAAAAPLIGGALNYFGQKEANKTNEGIAQQNRDFQATQSATAYQTARKDMEAAGINPILAHSQGGAQAMSGSTATAQNELGGFGDILSGVSSAFQQKQAQIQLADTLNTTETGRETQRTQQASNIASAQQSEATTKKIDQDRLNSIAQLGLATNDQKLRQQAQNQTLRNQKQEERLTNLRGHTEAARLGGIQSESDWQKAQNTYNVENKGWIIPLTKGTDTVGRVLDGISSALNIANKFRPSKPDVTEEHHDYNSRGQKTMTTRATYKGK